jgi:hypothetical protein
MINFMRLQPFEFAFGPAATAASIVSRYFGSNVAKELSTHGSNFSRRAVVWGKQVC